MTTGPLDYRGCRVCGCTDHRACVDRRDGACWWVEWDLCSHCARKSDARRDAFVFAAIAAVSALMCGALYFWSMHLG